MDFNKTPEPERDHSLYENYQKQKNTPTRAALLGAEAYAKYNDIAWTRRNMTAVFGISSRTQQRIEQEEPRTYHSRKVQSGSEDQRGRPGAINKKVVKDCVYYLKEKGFSARELPLPLLTEKNGLSVYQETLPKALTFNPFCLNPIRQSERLQKQYFTENGKQDGHNKPVHLRTFQRRLRKEGYRKHRSAVASYFTPAELDTRVEYCNTQLEQRPLPTDWKDTGWSDEFHFPITSVANPKWVTRKRGERHQPDCTQKRARTSRQVKKQQQENKEVPQQVHAWVFLHWEDREIVFYHVDNKTGKINGKCYTEQCLPAVIPLLKEKGLTLQEDGDTVHNGKVATAYKTKHGIQSFKTPAGSPDLSVAESFARPMKALYMARGHYQIEEARQHVTDVFFAIKQEQIQKWILGMPERLKRVIDMGGEGLPDM